MSAIANFSLDAVDADGHPFLLTVEIGAPYRHEKYEAWACPVSVLPLFDKLSDQVGEDSFQALCLGIRLTQALLEDFVSKGGSLLVGGEAFPFEAYFNSRV